ncbi:hypothetical protein AMJ85_03855, partial [candidate division BRC1 bacterium SM23_51]
LAAAILAIAAVACVRAPRPTGYLENYGGLLPQPPPYTSVYGERTAAGRQPRVDNVLQILPSRWNAEQLPRSLGEADLLDLLDNRLRVYLLRSTPSSVIVTRSRDVNDFVEAGANVTQLRVSITDTKRGIGLVRMLIGFQLGATELQVEGWLVDLETSKVLVRFARRGAHDGAVYGLPTPQSLSPTYCWRLSVDETAAMLARYVASQLTPPPPHWWENLSTPRGLPRE